MAAYASLAELRARLGYASGDTADDAMLLAVLEAVTLAINNDMHRGFHPVTQTRYYDAADDDRIAIDDLVSVTALATDGDGDGVYETTWTTADYRLMPVNAALSDPPAPYTYIVTKPRGSESFPTLYEASVAITGSFGYYDVRTTATATVSGAHNASVTTLTVSAGAEFSAGQTLLIDTEQLYVTAVSGTSLTVRRGQNGTTAASHSGAAAIQIYRYPIVTEAALLQASRLFRRKDAPFGVVASNELNTQMIMPRLDADVQRLLNPFRRITVG